jgi:hypothetical protein
VLADHERKRRKAFSKDSESRVSNSARVRGGRLILGGIFTMILYMEVEVKVKSNTPGTTSPDRVRGDPALA